MNNKVKLKLTDEEEREMDVISNIIIDLILDDSKRFLLKKHSKKANLNIEGLGQLNTKNGKNPRN